MEAHRQHVHVDDHRQFPHEHLLCGQHYHGRAHDGHIHRFGPQHGHGQHVPELLGAAGWRRHRVQQLARRRRIRHHRQGRLGRCSGLSDGRRQAASGQRDRRHLVARDPRRRAAGVACRRTHGVYTCVLGADVQQQRDLHVSSLVQQALQHNLVRGFRCKQHGGLQGQRHGRIHVLPVLEHDSGALQGRSGLEPRLVQHHERDEHVQHVLQLHQACRRRPFRVRHLQRCFYVQHVLLLPSPEVSGPVVIQHGKRHEHELHVLLLQQASHRLRVFGVEHRQGKQRQLYVHRMHRPQRWRRHQFPLGLHELHRGKDRQPHDFRNDWKSHDPHV